jgi:ribosomal protein L32
VWQVAGESHATRRSLTPQEYSALQSASPAIHASCSQWRLRHSGCLHCKTDPGENSRTLTQQAPFAEQSALPAILAL